MSYAERLTEGGIAIFLFHGVIECRHTAVRNYTRKHLERDYFVGILRELRARGNAMSMDDLVEHHQTGRPLPSYAFTITFDDGFENNLSVAAPILVDEGVPATFYVTTDFIDHNRMSWIDRIGYVIELAPRGTLQLPWGRCGFHDDEGKRALLDDIRLHVKASAKIDADGLAGDVQRQLGFPEIRSSEDPLDRKMTWEGVRQLAQQDGFTVGGHSHTHAILSFLDDDALVAEVGASQRLLAEKAGLPCRHYSYPEGLAHCYSDSVIAVLKAHGVLCCPTAEDGINAPPLADLFHLRRIAVV